MKKQHVETLRLVEKHGSVRAAAKAAGVHRSTMLNRNRAALAAKAASPELETADIVYPDLPESELPAPEIIDYACRNFETRQKARDARRWMEIKIRDRQPVGVCFIGDPHIDSPGCNWPLLREHVKILESTPGMYAIGGNDMTDNWIGRLLRLYADSKMTKYQAWKLVKWLLKDANIKWLCHILGNHDMWGDGKSLFKANAGIVPVEDWQARFQLVFPTGARVRVHMAHDFPGHSQWNSLHGAQKAAMWGDMAHIYACAHKHCWAIHEEEHAHRGFTYHLIRSRGYKAIDEYADLHGYGSQKRGASVTAVIDPTRGDEARIRCFPELEEAAEFLTWLRSRK